MKRLTAYAVALLLVGMSVPLSAAEPTLEDLNKRIAASNEVLKKVTEITERRIPKDLLRRCRGVAIFPGVMNVGLLVGVSFGNGVVLRRDEKTVEWSKPAFFTIRGGSVGAQAGAQSIELILLIMSEEGIQGLLENKYTLGADISVAAGPVGRKASAETDIRFDAGILSYSKAKGLFAGIALKGAALAPDMLANRVYHGEGITVQDVLYEGKGGVSEEAGTLAKTLSEASN